MILRTYKADCRQKWLSYSIGNTQGKEDQGDTAYIIRQALVRAPPVCTLSKVHLTSPHLHPLISLCYQLPLRRWAASTSLCSSSCSKHPPCCTFVTLVPPCPKRIEGVSGCVCDIHLNSGFRPPDYHHSAIFRLLVSRIVFRRRLGTMTCDAWASLTSSCTLSSSTATRSTSFFTQHSL
jgi:hypothetical protein